MNDLSQSIPENVGVVPVVEPPLQLLQVAVQVLDADLVEGSDDGPLEEAPDTFNAVGVDIAHDPLIDAVAHRLVAGIMVGDPQVGFQFISVDGFGLILHVAVDEAVQGLLLDVGNGLQSDLPATLHGTGHIDLVVSVAATHSCLLPSDQRLVHFDDPEQGGAFNLGVRQSLADSVAQIPSGLVVDAQDSLQLIGRDSLFGLNHHVDGEKPLAKRQVGVMHDGSGRDAELVATAETGPLVALRNLAEVSVTAASAADLFGPTQPLQELPALLFAGEPVNQPEQVDFRLNLFFLLSLFAGLSHGSISKA